MAHDLQLLIPEIAVLLTAIGALVCEMLRLPRAALAVSVAGLLFAAALALPLVGAHTTAFSGTFRVDGLSTWAALTLLPATALSTLLARAEIGGSDREGTVYSLLCFTALGALILAGSGDVMLLVLGVLLSSLGSFALVAYGRDDPATEAAMKFFVFGSVSGALMIFGLTYWFGVTGSTLFVRLGSLEHAPLAAAVGLVALIVGLGYKASLVPFHFWAPDAYDGAPVSVAAFLSVVTKIGAIFALAQVVRDLPVSSNWPLVIAVLSVLTMTYGNLAALVQQNVVRLLAYSSIAQSGYFLLGVVAMGGHPLAQRALVVFAVAYVAMNIGAFAVVLRTGRTLDDFTGLGRRRVVTGVAMVVFLLSLVGIPPLGGFVGKFLLFGAAMSSGFLWLAVAAILNSVLSLAVYLRIVVPMYRQSGGSTTPAPKPLVTVVWAIALLVTLGIAPAAQELIARVGQAVADGGRQSGSQASGCRSDVNGSPISAGCRVGGGSPGEVGFSGIQVRRPS